MTAPACPECGRPRMTVDQFDWAEAWNEERGIDPDPADADHTLCWRDVAREEWAAEECIRAQLATERAGRIEDCAALGEARFDLVYALDALRRAMLVGRAAVVAIEEQLATARTAREAAEADAERLAEPLRSLLDLVSPFVSPEEDMDGNHTGDWHGCAGCDGQWTESADSLVHLDGCGFVAVRDALAAHAARLR